MSTHDKGDALAKIDKALQHVYDICQGRQKWTMRVPADVERDSDLILCEALESARKLLDTTVTSAVGAISDAKDAARFRFRHSQYVDPDGYEYGYCKVRWKNGAVESMLWADDEEIDAAMVAAGVAISATNAQVPLDVLELLAEARNRMSGLWEKSPGGAFTPLALTIGKIDAYLMGKTDSTGRE